MPFQECQSQSTQGKWCRKFNKNERGIERVQACTR